MGRTVLLEIVVHAVCYEIEKCLIDMIFILTNQTKFNHAGGLDLCFKISTVYCEGLILML